MNAKNEEIISESKNEKMAKFDKKIANLCIYRKYNII